MEESTVNSLVSAALEARKAAYTPYSHFAVGAALLCAVLPILAGFANWLVGVLAP
jgi:cytidine deaminase